MRIHAAEPAVEGDKDRPKRPVPKVGKRRGGGYKTPHSLMPLVKRGGIWKIEFSLGLGILPRGKFSK